MCFKFNFYTDHRIDFTIKTLEDITYVMKTEGTIFIFEWMFVLYGSFRIREPYTDELERLFRSQPA